MNILNKLNSFINFVACLFLGILTTLVVLQVFYRFVLVKPLQQSEELATFSMVWLIMLASTTLIKNKSHIAVTFFLEKFPPGLQKVLRVFNLLQILVVCIIIAVYGFKLSMGAMGQIAPASRISMGLVMSAVPAFGLIGTLYTIENLFKEIFNKSNEEITTNQTNQEAL